VREKNDALSPTEIQQRRFVEPRRCADGGVVRGSVEHPRIALVFTGHKFAEGSPLILDVLAQHRAKASFFVTARF